MNGRFAPSPTGPLHLGNLRTALIAWCGARHSGRGFIVRMEDLDRVTSSHDHEAQQLADLAALGLDWDGVVERQSDRFDLHRDALRDLVGNDLTFDCYCTRRDIADATRAPHGTHGANRYPGTCRRLSARQIRAFELEGRRPAIRLRTDDSTHPNDRAAVHFDDLVCGPQVGIPDDIVLQRNDGIPAYHLAVVVDDAAQGVSQVVRGDDLLESTPSQVQLSTLLGLATPTYAHVPLVLGEDGTRLAKRHGAVSLAERTALLGSVGLVVAELAASCGLTSSTGPVSVQQVLEVFGWSRLDRSPWRLSQRSEPTASASR